MHVLYLTKDLFFSARVCTLARETGSTIDVFASPEACLAKHDTLLAIIDLGLDQLDVAVAVRRVREIAHHATIIAYGPHVDTIKLSAAVQAGCDLVLPRSQFSQQIGGILQTAKSLDDAE